MRKPPGPLLMNLIGLFILTACTSSNTSVPPASVTSSPLPTATEVKALPTFSSPGNSILWHDLQVTMRKNEITENFLTKFGSERNPPPGSKFMWVDVQLKNIGEIEIDTPQPEHFSVLYAASELKPTYGYRQGYTEYFSLQPILFPGDNVEAWLRFDIPETAGAKDLHFVFLPESSQVGTSFSSPIYPYAENKATFVWNCIP